ncbi:MAG: hypothetical protein JO058_14980 [Alphaproteobacteria bacterium]|nr:hypothetical protein [Alphaproteobacteria bacterium]
MTWLNVLFTFGIVLAVIAQVLAYLSGKRTWLRLIVMVMGVASTISLFAAGQIAGAVLRDYVNSVGARQAGGGL